MPRPTLETTEKQIRQATATIDQGKTRVQQLEARRAAKLKAIETARRFKAGDVVLARAMKDSDFAMLLQRILDQDLKTDRDRKLFGLPSRD